MLVFCLPALEATRCNNKGFKVSTKKPKVDFQGKDLHFSLFLTRNSNYFPEPRLGSFLLAQFETSFLLAAQNDHKPRFITLQGVFRRISA